MMRGVHLGIALVALAVFFSACPLQASGKAGGAVSSSVSASSDVQVVVGKSAEDVVRALYTTLQQVMKEGESLGFAGRYKRLEPTLRAAFDFPFMTRFAVGLPWAKATPAEQAAAAEAFVRYSIATYASRFVRDDGEHFAVLGHDDMPVGTMVKTTLTPRGDKPVALNYLMRKDATGVWRIVDVYMDGAISELATRRADFAAVVRGSGLPALTQNLNDKATQMGK